MAYRQSVPAYADPRGIPGVLQDIRENYRPRQWRGLCLGFLRFADRYHRFGRRPEATAKARFYLRLADALWEELPASTRPLPLHGQVTFAFLRNEFREDEHQEVRDGQNGGRRSA